MKKRITTVILLMSLLFSSFFIPGNPTAAAAEEIGIDTSVTASQTAIILNDGASGEVSVNLKAIPKGVAVNNERAPIDVVFVFDKSGSMMDDVNYVANGKNIKESKLSLAKNAMAKAINTFNDNNKKGNDRFGLILFDSNVSSQSQTALSTNLFNISSTISKLDNVTGGTDYTSALNAARNVWDLPANKTIADFNQRKKYIIFLTDGKPTEYEETIDTLFGSIIRKYFLAKSDGKDFVVREQYGRQTILNSKETYDYYQGKIKENARLQAQSIADKGITMNSIGFGQEEELDLDLLNELSQKSRGKAEHVTNTEIINILGEYSKNMSSIIPILSGGHILITVPENVTVKEKLNVVTKLPDNQYRVNLDTIIYGPRPSIDEITRSIELVFNKKGTYPVKFNFIYNGFKEDININQTVTFQVEERYSIKEAYFEPIILKVGEKVNLNEKLKIKPLDAYDQVIQALASINGNVTITVNQGIYTAVGKQSGIDTIRGSIGSGKFPAEGTVTVIQSDASNSTGDYKW